jgi:3-oxoacyl-[acyl-carrier-protein] synthase-3
MVVKLATAAGRPPAKLYSNIAKVGNTSSVSVPIAIIDALTDAVTRERCRNFAPVFGARAVAGDAILRVDPAMIAGELDVSTATHVSEAAPAFDGSGVKDVQAAFGDRGSGCDEAAPIGSSPGAAARPLREQRRAAAALRRHFSRT